MSSMLTIEQSSIQQSSIEIRQRPQATWLDRFAMRLGLVLLRWGMRVPDTDRSANQQYLEREQRERQWLMMSQHIRPF